MHRGTGRALSGIEHVVQSLGVLLTTPIGSRVMRREYGSLVPDLIDQPDNGATRVRLVSAIAGAVMRWEPRVRISRVQLQRGDEPGQATVLLSGTFLAPEGPQQLLALRVPLQSRAAA